MPVTGDRRTVTLEQLQSFYRDLLTALGGTTDEAEAFAEFYSVGDLRGMDWQGLKALHKHIVQPVEEGIIRLGAEAEEVSSTSATSVLEANGQLGQLVCSHAMRMAIDQAKENGLGAVIIRRAGDSGLLGAYTQLAPAEDCIGVMFNNTNPYVAPWGGVERVLGLDPLSVAVPSSGQYPILLDTSVVDSAAFDRPERYEPPYPPPAVVSFQSVREYGMAVVLEAMCSALALIEVGRDKVRRGECGVVVIAMHVGHFVDPDEFRSSVGHFVNQIKSSETADGVQEILLPGERGYRESARRRVEGIPVPEDVWQRTIEIAQGLDLDWRTSLVGA